MPRHIRICRIEFLQPSRQRIPQNSLTTGAPSVKRITFRSGGRLFDISGRSCSSGFMDYPMYIAGEPVRTSAARDVRLPFDGSVVGTIFEAGKEQVDAAIAAAAAAAPVMREMTRDERSVILRRAW